MIGIVITLVIIIITATAVAAVTVVQNLDQDQNRPGIITGVEVTRNIEAVVIVIKDIKVVVIVAIIVIKGIKVVVIRKGRRKILNSQR